VTDDLSAVLDDAAYANEAVATSGTVEVANDTLVWSGPLALGETATITYSVVANLPASGDRTLRNTVLSASAGANCVAADPPAGCTATVTVLVPSLRLTKTAPIASGRPETPGSRARPSSRPAA
jgi:large repetitive protein